MEGRDTLQRRAIKSAVDRAARPLLPSEVWELALAAAPGLGIATVYRNLKALHDAGEVQAVDLPGDGGRRYERAHLHHHHHFRCRGCDRVFDVEGCSAQLTRHAPPGFRVESHELVLHGLCDLCGAADET